MDKLKVLIVDDEEHSREVLQKLLYRDFPDVEIVGEASSVDEAYKEVLEKKPGLVFLDIQMPGTGGFSLLKKFDPLPFEVVFVTSFDEYAVTAIKFKALDYLLKPVEVQDLKDAVAKAWKRKSQTQGLQHQIINLLHHFDTEPQEHRFAVHVGENVKLISEKDVVYIEADNRYCELFLNDNKKYTTARHLKEFEDYFGPTSSFVRISRTFMVNTNYIEQYSKGLLFTIEMKNGKVIEVPRRKKTEILEKLKTTKSR